MEKLKFYLDEWFNTEIKGIIERNILDINFPSGTGLAIAGVRRSGKTYLLFELAEKLRKSFPLHNVIYVNFEDDRLLPLKGEELTVLPSVLRQNFDIDTRKEIFFLLDEIQEIPGWEKAIRSFIDRKIAKIIITGSTKDLTAREISSKLAGRIISKVIYPLSFKEFLKFKNFEYDFKSLKYSKHDELMRYFLEYLEYGGFPEVVLSDNKKELLSSYFMTIFYRDLIEKYSIRKVKEFEVFIRLTIRNSGSLLSWKKILNFMKSIGIKISKNTLMEYLNYAEFSFLLKTVEIFSYRLKDRLQYPVKVYCVDNGFLNLIQFKTKIDYGILLENLVCIELLRRNKNIFYWKNQMGEEVDFVLIDENMKPYELIQVCWDIDSEDTKKREIKALLKAMKEFGLKKAFVITKDYSGEEKIDDKRIIYKPFWLWVLKSE